MYRTKLIIALAAILAFPTTLPAQTINFSAGRVKIKNKKATKAEDKEITRKRNVKTTKPSRTTRSSRNGQSSNRGGNNYNYYIQYDSDNNNVIVGSETVGREKKRVSAFNSINVSSVINVVYRKGSPSVTVEAPDNCLDLITCEVKNGCLYLDLSRNYSIRSTSRIEFTAYVSCPELTGVTFSGTGYFKTENLDVKDFSLIMSGTGSFYSKAIHAYNLTIRTSGTGYINATTINATTKAQININGTGSLKARSLTSPSISLLNAGTGDMNMEEGINCTDLEIRNSSTGDVYVGWIRANKCTLRNTGTGSMKFNSVESPVLKLLESGTGDLTVKGIVADTLAVRGSGTGTVRIYGKWKDISLAGSFIGRIYINDEKLKFD